MTRLVQCAIIKVQGKGIPEPRVKKKNQRNLKKPLDKITSLYYNKYIKKKKGIDTMTKMTYVNALEIAIATVENAEAKAKLEALKASIAKKNSAERKPTATQKANEGYKVAILEFLVEGGKHTITDIMKGCGAVADLSNQRVSAIVRQLVEGGQVVREEIKRKAYFSAVEGGEDA